MISSAHNRLFGPGGCLTSMAIRSYLDGSLPHSGKRQVEEHIGKCRLCAEALKGFKKHGGKRIIQSDLDILSRKIRRTYTGEMKQQSRRITVLLLFSLVAFLAILLGIFYIFRQYTVDQKVQMRELPDSIMHVVNTVPDSALPAPEKPNGSK